MKTAIRLLILFVFVSVFNTFGQTTHYITLYVNTSAIDDGNTSTTCNFGQEDGISNEDYTIEAAPGDIIIWNGVSSSSPNTDIVNIMKIKYESGTDVFNKKELEGNGQSGETVIGTVQSGKKDDVLKYKIEFTVYNNNSKRGKYKIDPVIKIN